MTMATATDYYVSGNKDLATETALTVQRLEPRSRLTKTANRTIIVLVGLPARGKSFVARKLLHFLNWTGVHCRVFNVGKYRRDAYAELMSATTEQAHSGACDANFFDPANAQASELRERVADCALRDMLRWLDHEESSLSDSDEDTVVPESSRHSSLSVNSTSTAQRSLDFRHHERVAIFDATNSTHARRQWILEECTSPLKRGHDKPTGLVFVESICDDVELLEENYRYKVSSSPDFAGMPMADAMADLRARVAKYEAQYETIQDDALSYIKVFNLSTKLLVNHIYGRMAKEVVPALMAWHIGTRPVFLCRPGQTMSGICTDGEDYVHRGRQQPSTEEERSRFQSLSRSMQRKSLRGDTLGPHGQQFRRDLLDFLADEGHQFMIKRASVRDMAQTGTSISGLRPGPGSSVHHWGGDPSDLHHPPQDPLLPAIPESRSHASTAEPFPLRIYTSTMPRAADTVAWEEEGEAEFTPIQRSNLNPLDKGDFAGLELDEIRELNPAWFAKLERDPYNTRFPGGESYRDLMSRLTSVVIDVEQEVVPTLVVSHVSILQCLMAYFRNTRVEQCMSIEVPLHTVIKFTPVRGGGWSESHHPLYEVDGGGLEKEGRPGSIGSLSQLGGGDGDSHSGSCSSLPIWGDSIMLSPRPPLTKRISH